MNEIIKFENIEELIVEVKGQKVLLEGKTP
jgi:hypothetical protein